MATKVDNERDEKSLFDKLFNRGKEDAAKRNFLKFVEQNKGNFWNTVDATIIEVAGKLEKNISAEFGSEIAKASSRAGYSRTLTDEKKAQFQERAKKFVNPSLLADLSKVINGLSDYLSEKQENYYILIDGLEDHWVEPEIKNTIVHSLFEACKGLRKIRNLKVVVSLRNDIYEKMNIEYPPSQGQLEKNEDYIVRIKWSKEQLWELVERRIGYLFRWKYTKDGVHFVDLFKSSYDNKKRSWIYMVERTLHRPRDIIKYINFCFQAAEGKSEISISDFGTDEGNYSQDRLDALKAEWAPVFPGIDIVINQLANRATYLSVGDFCHSRFVEDLAIAFADKSYAHTDTLWLALEDATSVESSAEPLGFAKEVFHRLHLIGAVGLKLSATSPWHWMHQTHKPVSINSITSETKIAIHQMLWRGLGNIDRKEHRS